MSRGLESSISRQIRSQGDLAGKLVIASDFIAALGSRFNPETVEIVLAELRSGSDGLQSWVEALPPTVNTAYLRAMLVSELGGDAAPAAWEQFFSLHAGRDPFHRLAYARGLAGQQRVMDAARQLQLALSQPVRYSFFPRAEKLVRTVSEQVSWYLRQTRVAVLGANTTSLLIPILQALCLRDRIRAEFYQGLYGAVQQEILDPESGLAKFRPEVVFLVAHWRDLGLPASTSEESQFIARLLDQQKSLWLRLSEQFGCHVVQHAYDFPAEEPSSALAGGRSRMITAINARLQQEPPDYVSILDTPAVCSARPARSDGKIRCCGIASNSILVPKLCRL